MVVTIICSIITGFITAIFGFIMGMQWPKRQRMSKQTGTKEQASEPSLFHNIEQVFGNVLYRTEGSTILAVDDVGFADRTERYLMKSPTGRYFVQVHNRYISGSEDASIFPYTKDQAMRSYNHTVDKRVSFEEAFGEKLIEA